LNIPWLELVEINITNNIEVNLLVRDLLPEVVLKKLLLGGVEPEARWDLRLSIDRYAHVFRHSGG